MSTRKVGILTSGGDCPGLNAVLRGAVVAADRLNWEVLGFEEGYEGLLPPSRYTRLDIVSTEGIAHLGGTILGTTNKGHFARRTGHGRPAVTRAALTKAAATVRELDLAGLIVVGGNGSMDTARRLHEMGAPIVGVPKSIDNDLEATSMTFGFDSAVTTVADAVDRLRTTGSSHRRVMVLEVMGRSSGWIALHGGLAGAGDVILIPEIPFDIGKVAETVLRRGGAGCRSTVIIVAEGAHPKDGKPMMRRTRSGEYRFGGIGDLVTREIAKRTRDDVRNCVLGHLQRGGPPSALDRILATGFGVDAVRLIRARKFGRMVSYQNSLIKDVPIAKAVHGVKRVTSDNQMVRTARALGISFGD